MLCLAFLVACSGAGCFWVLKFGRQNLLLLRQDCVCALRLLVVHITQARRGRMIGSVPSSDEPAAAAAPSRSPAHTTRSSRRLALACCRSRPTCSLRTLSSRDNAIHRTSRAELGVLRKARVQGGNPKIKQQMKDGRGGKLRKRMSEPKEKETESNRKKKKKRPWTLTPPLRLLLLTARLGLSHGRRLLRPRLLGHAREPVDPQRSRNVEDDVDPEQAVVAPPVVVRELEE